MGKADMIKFEDIWKKVEGIPGLHTREEARFLYLNASKLPPYSILVEIGTWDGRMAIVMGYAVKDNNGMVFTVDSYIHYKMGDHDLERTKLFIKEQGLSNVLPIQGLSSAVARSWVMPINLLFIDGDHKYRSVKQDIKSWLPYVRDEGWAMFHDYVSNEGVKRAVDENFESGRLEKEEQVDTLLKTTKLIIKL